MRLVAEPEKRERVAVVTGAGGAVGGAAVRALATRGFRVIACVRPGGSGVAESLEVAGAPALEVETFDLARPASVRAASARILARHPAIDALVLAAAVYSRRRVVTPEGFEQMFATNHLGPFLLTHELRPALARAPAARVLTISAPSTTPLDFDDLQSERRFSAIRVFGATKTANLLFSYELARRTAGTSVRSNACFPGVVRSGLMHEAPAIIRFFAHAAGRPPDAAGEAIAELARDPRIASTTGTFFRLTSASESPPYTRDPANQARLWRESERLLGLSAADA